MCLFAASIITLVMCLILIWGLYSAHVFIFISITMISLVLLSQLTIAMITFAGKFQTRLTLQEQLPKLGERVQSTLKQHTSLFSDHLPAGQ